MDKRKKNWLGTAILAVAIGGVIGLVRVGRLSGRGEGGPAEAGCGGVDSGATGATGALTQAVGQKPHERPELDHDKDGRPIKHRGPKPRLGKDTEEFDIGKDSTTATTTTMNYHGGTV